MNTQIPNNDMNVHSHNNESFPHQSKIGENSPIHTMNLLINSGMMTPEDSHEINLLLCKKLKQLEERSKKEKMESQMQTLRAWMQANPEATIDQIPSDMTRTVSLSALLSLKSDVPKQQKEHTQRKFKPSQVSANSKYSAKLPDEKEEELAIEIAQLLVENLPKYMNNCAEKSNKTFHRITVGPEMWTILMRWNKTPQKHYNPRIMYRSAFRANEVFEQKQISTMQVTANGGRICSFRFQNAE